MLTPYPCEGRAHNWTNWMGNYRECLNCGQIMKHPDAGLDDRIGAPLKPRRTTMDDAPQAEMPRYRCHKEVWALKIAALKLDEQGRLMMTPAEGGYAPIHLSNDFIQKHGPLVGGYYVVYRDGYKSFSPADAFEDGYTLIP